MNALNAQTVEGIGKVCTEARSNESVRAVIVTGGGEKAFVAGADINELAKKSPIIMKLGRDSFYRTQDMEFHAALEYLQAQLSIATMTEDTKEGVMAFFEKREPDFKGR